MDPMGEPEIGATESTRPSSVPTNLSSPSSVVHRAAKGDAPPTDQADSNRRLQTLAFELTVAAARERQRIAHALHDDLGQLLAMAQFKLSELISRLARDATQPDPLEEVRLLLCQAAQATRAATFELYSPVLQQLGLLAAVEGLAQQLQRDSRMRVHLTARVDDLPLSDAVLSVLFRIVRELALNAQKHAKASNLWISLEQDEQDLRIALADDGVGFDAAAALRRFSPQGGFGLLSAEAQMQAIGGRLCIESVPGGGTIATLHLGFDVAASLPPSAKSIPTFSHPTSHL